MNCEKCETKIPKERLKALPDTTTCVRCSDVKKIIGYNVYDHKTAPQLMFVDANDDEAVRIATRDHRRAR